MKNKLRKWSFTFAAIAICPITLIACNAESNDLPKVIKKDEQPKQNPKLSVNYTIVDNAEYNQTTLTLDAFHQDLDYSKNYQLVLREHDIDGKNPGRFVKSNSFKFDENQNSISLDQKNGIDRAAEIQKQYNDVIWYQATQSVPKSTRFAPLASQKIEKILVPGLSPNKTYLLWKIDIENEEQTKPIWEREQQVQKFSFDTLDTEFFASSKAWTHIYDAEKNEFVITYYLNTKKIIDTDTNWTYKLNLEVEKTDETKSKVSSYYLSNAYKSQNSNVLNNNVAFEVRVWAQDPKQKLAIKNANVAATWSFSREQGQANEFTYITLIK